MATFHVIPCPSNRPGYEHWLVYLDGEYVMFDGRQTPMRPGLEGDRDRLLRRLASEADADWGDVVVWPDGSESTVTAQAFEDAVLYKQWTEAGQGRT